MLIIILGFPGQLRANDSTDILLASKDSMLQQAVETVVRDRDLSHAVETRQLALAMLIVTDPDKPLLAELNGHHMVYAASLPKIAILLGAAVAIDEGRLELDEELRTNLHNMIRISCNSCATWVLGQVGRDQLLQTLRSPEYAFYDGNQNGGLWVGKDYGPSSAYRRDPLAGISHGATAFQAARFYYELQRGALVSPEQSEMMLDVLSRPGIWHKFVRGLSTYPDLELYRKSGTWKTYHADSVLVRTDGLAYILVGLANNPNGDAWLESLAAPLHEAARLRNTAQQ